VDCCSCTREKEEGFSSSNSRSLQIESFRIHWRKNNNTEAGSGSAVGCGSQLAYGQVGVSGPVRRRRRESSSTAASHQTTEWEKVLLKRSALHFFSVCLSSTDCLPFST